MTGPGTLRLFVCAALALPAALALIACGGSGGGTSSSPSAPPSSAVPRAVITN